MNLRIFQFIPETRAEGPGVRACVQVQGCPIRCPGCGVPHSWPEAGGRVVDVRKLAGDILHGPSVEGVTFLGGEPFAQAAALADLGRLLQQQSLSVVTFSGYYLEALQAARRPEYEALLSVTDLLIDGPFERERLDLSRPWVGSRNQRYHFLTERYRPIAASIESIPNRLEVRVGPDGRILMNGLGDVSTMRGLLRRLT